MTDVLVTIRLADGETEQYHIDYLPTLEAAYAASYGGRPQGAATGSSLPRQRPRTGATNRTRRRSQAPGE
jgi:hypothetical protein